MQSEELWVESLTCVQRKNIYLYTLKSISNISERIYKNINTVVFSREMHLSTVIERRISFHFTVLIIEVFKSDAHIVLFS